MFSKAGVLALNGSAGGVLSTDFDRADREAGDDCDCALTEVGVLTADCDLTVAGVLTADCDLTKAGVLGPDRALMEVGVLDPDSCAPTDGDSVPTADCNPAGGGSKSKSVSLTLSPSALLAATSRAIFTLL